MNKDSENILRKRMSGYSSQVDLTDFVREWKSDYTLRVKESSQSRKHNFNYDDAVKRSPSSDNKLDRIMIQYLKFIDSKPLKNNDFFKYVDSYRKGKKLHDKYFRHDLKKLYKYYAKVDKDLEAYNPFCEYQYKKYVLFMMLKFSDLYTAEFDAMFNVKTEGYREYNPLTSIPSVLRQSLPFIIKEYDIFQAYPSFIFSELELKPFDVYSHLEKRKFNILVNTHSAVEGATIEAVRAKLQPIYGERVEEVITEPRFENKGQLFNDLSKYEAEYVKRFVEENEVKHFVRLHDGVVTSVSEQCQILEFDQIKFKVKEFNRPEIENTTINFYNSDYKTSPVNYSRFFEQEGFLRITQEGHDHLTILKNDNRIVTPINHKTDLVPILKDNINEFNSEPLENCIARDSTNIIQQSLQLLKPVPMQFHKDTKKRCDIPFKNGIARVTKDTKEIISYDEVNGFFAKHSTQKHNFSFRDIDQNRSDFANFLFMAATNKDVRTAEITEDDEKAISAFCSMFGYLVINYKDPAFNPSIILSDENANDEIRNGGRGKSLLQEALRHIRVSITKGGNSYDPKYTHVHADLKKEHDVYLLDDVPSNFDYNSLYTNITGSIDAQRKGAKAETIEFADTPKFVISTNWAVRYDAEATSTNRRFVEYKFSDFWNIDNQPLSVFGKSFFTDWNQSEWNAFYNFALFCAQHYLKYGLERIGYDKKQDNFQAYFYNDSILHETHRIFDVLAKEEFISVTDFVNVHQMHELFKYKPVFTIKNARKYIDSFIEYHDRPYKYSKRLRKWEHMMPETDFFA